MPPDSGGGNNVELSARENAPVVDISVTVEAVDRTGVEMEALTGVSAAALTIYDMVKAIDRDVYIAGIGLAEKTGGRSGHYARPSEILNPARFTDLLPTRVRYGNQRESKSRHH